MPEAQRQSEDISDLHIEPQITFDLDDFESSRWQIDTAKLFFKITDQTRVDVQGVMKIRLEDGSEEIPLLILDKNAMCNVVDVLVDGKVVSEKNIVIGEKNVVIRVDKRNFELTIDTTLSPEAVKQANGLYMAGRVMLTQCEAISFRNILPFLDRPDVMTKWTTTVEADKSAYPVLLANGNMIASSENTDGTHRATFENPFTMPSYLFAMVAGNLTKFGDTYTTKSGRRINLEIYAEPGMEESCKLPMAALKEAMAWDEERWGVECDLDDYKVVIVSKFNAGAMENKGLNIFSDGHGFASEDTRTNSEVEGTYSVYAHEYGHNLRGDRVGVRSWHEITLKEGFTRLTDQFFSEDKFGPTARIDQMIILRNLQFPEDKSPDAHAILKRSYDIDPMKGQMYNTTSYGKGAEVLRMLHTFVGEEGFRKGLELYKKKFDGKAITVTDLIEVLGEAAKFDVEQFKNWLNQVGTPKVKASRVYDSATQTLRLHLEQSCPKPPFDALQMPVAIKLIGPDGAEVPIVLEDAGNGNDPARGVLNFNQANQTFVFKNVPAGTAPSLFRKFSAPIELETDTTHEESMQVAKFENDAVSKYEACEAIKLKGLRSMIQAMQTSEDPDTVEVDEKILDAFKIGMDVAMHDPALGSRLLGNPLIMSILSDSDIYDFENANRALDKVRIAVAAKFEKELVALYEQYKGAPNEKIFDGQDLNVQLMARRDMKSQALSLLSNLGGRYVEMAKNQFDTANNMDERFKALQALLKYPEGKPASDEFYNEWKNDASTLAKLLLEIGRSESEEAVNNVKEFTESDKFDVDDTTAIFKLIIAGLGRNTKRLHEITVDEKGVEHCIGYEFMAKMVSRIKNQYWSARLVKDVFGLINHLDEKRQHLMRKELVKLQEREDIDENTKLKIVGCLESVKT